MLLLLSFTSSPTPVAITWAMSPIKATPRVCAAVALSIPFPPVNPAQLVVSTRWARLGRTLQQ
eukprot:CAMPEP_0206496932 /NCGR_PEP_ID=MMETSP0324_2-20121206/49807_1 /ASSEMBLY_ACC=CAM_ASM_000836 /TAXON_ID=2866 /ORGANISM="Crypthecodinium cohnii, Strain Seligo" /LENGTH=62 /DNA_ID=CAMNT_0053982251 /DNA_START=8 /DNA_END=193 /DNA_ORIENTATION=-